MSIELINASNIGDIILVRNLILKGDDINYIGEGGSTPLIEASKNGHDKVIQLLVASNVNAKATDVDGMNALMHAAYMKNTNAVKLLLLYTSIDINAIDKFNNNALIYCLKAEYEFKYKEHFKSHFSNEGGSNALNIRSTTYPFQKPISYQNISNASFNIEILKALLENNADVNLIDKNGKTALIYATSLGNGEAVKLLLNANPNINHVDCFGITALINAVRLNKIEAAIELINAGADINCKDNLRSSALTFPDILGNKEIMKNLISKGASLDTYLLEISSKKIQIMLNTAKYVDYLLDNKRHSFDHFSEVDPEILISKYEFLLNQPELSLETLYRQMDKLNSCILASEYREQLNKIFLDVISKRAENPEEEAKILNFSSSSIDTTLSEEDDASDRGSLNNSDDMGLTGDALPSSQSDSFLDDLAKCFLDY